jgi:hypothetical protein
VSRNQTAEIVANAPLGLIEYEEYAYDDADEAQDVDVKKIPNCPHDKEQLDVDAYAPPMPERDIGDGLS